MVSTDVIRRSPQGEYKGSVKEDPYSPPFIFYLVIAGVFRIKLQSPKNFEDNARKIFSSYASKLLSLIVDIASKVADSLGLVSYLFHDWPCHLRLNRYNFTEETVGSSGVQIHTDSGFLTVLQEDESVGGLEIMDSAGNFVAVDPVSGTFLVNLGDVAKAWSNGRLHNVKHRVQCKEALPRISIALFLLAPKDDKVEPHHELVDAEHPLLYQTFTYESLSEAPAVLWSKGW